MENPSGECFGLARRQRHTIGVRYRGRFGERDRWGRLAFNWWVPLENHYICAKISLSPPPPNSTQYPNHQPKHETRADVNTLCETIRIDLAAHARHTSAVTQVRWHHSIIGNHYLYAISFSHMCFHNSVHDSQHISPVLWNYNFGRNVNAQNRVLSCLLLTFLRAKLQGGQSYMYKVTPLISFVTQKIYTTFPSWRAVSLLLPVGCQRTQIITRRDRRRPRLFIGLDVWKEEKKILYATLNDLLLVIIKWYIYIYCIYILLKSVLHLYYIYII